jgi:SAM-dependent methyltransferase
MTTQATDFGRAYATKHFSTDTPLAIQQLTQNRYRSNPNAMLDHLLRCLALQGTESVLDLGCGNGLILHNVATRMSDGGEITALDINKPMLDAAQRNTPFSWVDIDFVCGDAEEVEVILPGPYDRIMANYIFHYIADAPALCAQLQRILSPGGRLIVTTEGLSSMPEMYTIHLEAMQRVGFDKDLLSRAPRGRRGSLPLETGGELLREYFSDVTLRRYEDSLVFRSPEPFMKFYADGHGFCGVRSLAGDDVPEEYFELLYSAVLQTVESVIEKDGCFKLSKENGTFVCFGE